MFNPDFMEVANGTLTLLFISILWFFGKYIYYNLKGGLGTSGAIAFFTIMFGEVLIRGSAWIQRSATSKGYMLEWATIVPFLLSGVVICIIGGSCVIRVFVPQSTRKQTYISSISSVIISFLIALSVWLIPGGWFH